MPKPPKPQLTISEMGRLGGLARAAKLSPERRREIAAKASKAAAKALKLRQKEEE